jgi:hypothetical protein
MKAKNLKEIFPNIESILATIGLISIIIYSGVELAMFGSMATLKVLSQIVIAMMFFYFGVKSQKNKKKEEE